MFNGMNGSAKGSNDALQWKVGLVNSNGKYLTAEVFGNKINASGTTMRQKQKWTLEISGSAEDSVYIRSHLNKYLTTDKKGNVFCEAETRQEAEEFRIGYGEDGRWTFQSKSNTYFFGGSGDNLRCYEKAPTNTERWVVRLAVHPQVSIQNLGRKKYARLATDSNEQGCIQIDEMTPWGQDALITLEYEESVRKYAVRACDNRYLSRDGTLVQHPNADTYYTLELRSQAGASPFSGIALKDSTGRYLTALGKDGVMQARKNTVSKDELFTLEDSHPQVFFTAHNQKKVSTKQGIDLFANQNECGDTETFQVEFDSESEHWRIRTSGNKYWKVNEATGGVQNSGNGTSPKELFDIVHMDTGEIAILSGDKYVTARMNGSLYATADCLDNTGRFYMTIVNRPILVLRGDYGFIAFKIPGNSSNPRIECNKSTYDITYMEHTDGASGEYYLKGSNAKYWTVDQEGNTISASSEERQPFQFEFRGLTRISIKAPNGLYLRGEQNGTLTASSSTVTKDCLWEF